MKIREGQIAAYMFIVFGLSLAMYLMVLTYDDPTYKTDIIQLIRFGIVITISVITFVGGMILLFIDDLMVETRKKK